jgi:hypothetical protein
VGTATGSTPSAAFPASTPNPSLASRVAESLEALQALQDILSLVSREVPMPVLQAWSAEQRQQAEKWAGAVHLAASDNPVRVPEEPGHVRPWAPRQYLPALLALLTMPLAVVLPQLRALMPCAEAREWLASQRTAPLLQAWLTCPRGDWLLWLAARAGVQRQQVVLAACACARLALKYVKPGEDRPLRAIEAAEGWARGEPGFTLERVRAAAAAYAYAYAADAADAADAAAAYAAAAAAAYAYAADAAAADAADAADAAAADAAAAAAYAADAAAAYAADAAAAADAADARSRMQADCATKVRELLPLEVVLEALSAQALAVNGGDL